MTERREAPKTLPGWVWGGLFGCTVILSWMGWNKYRPVTAEEKAKFASSVGGEKNREVIRSAGRAYVTRVQLRTKQPKDYPEFLGNFDAVSEPELLAESDLEELKSLLVSPRNFRSDLISCAPVWDFRIRFMTDDDAIELWIDLECDSMLFVRDGAVAGSLLYAPIEHKIHEMAIRLFPGDAAIEEAAK